MKIDIHAHILPRDWPDLTERYGYEGFIRLEHHCPGCARMMLGDKCFRVVDENLWNPDVRIEECDRSGVDVQVLSTVPVMFSYWAKPDDTHDLCKLLNDHLAEVVQKYPRRFVALGTLPMQAPELAVIELERCIAQLGFAGVEIGTHINGRNLDDPEFYPVWEAAEQHGAAVFVHPWDMMGMKDLPNYWLPWLVSMPAETSRAICSLMMGGVIERFPGVRFAFAHGGGSFPATLGRINRGFTMRPDLCQTHTETEPRELFKRIYIDSLVHDPLILRFMVETFGSERIALGTDYPFPLGELVAGELIESINEFSPATKERLLSGTALEWLGKSRESFETPSSRAHSDALHAAHVTP
ncbi:MAG: amidohydrolase [Bradymonadaceae bacterium]|nr:amidohydrolase [Lujinxingiaceae bacterium]